MRNLLCLLVLLLTSVQETLAAPVLGAENPLPEMWPGAVYDPSIPTYEQVLGYPVGARISRYEDMLRFFTALQAAAPARLKLIDYGKTWEGRRLVYAVIGNTETIARLDQITTDMQRLADPRITDLAAASQLIASLPASIWLAYGIHGNEISSTDAAMLTAYHLLAANAETVSLKVADNSLVFIDPLQNPDGRARFTQHYYSSVGLQDSPDRISAEHNEPWPGGRTNHYLFDLNRDWLALTQPETQSRVLALNKHLPLVVIDFHEMGGDESYYFAPAADRPYLEQNPLHRWMRLLF
ncbi:M14 family zinc carboxypeptidase [Pseudomonadales bacterium]|nr:M14 family zinc carboxypeptidase [Pseudomonadales bacterium]